ncbi:MAG: hypothetical protein ACM3YN_07945 [Parcubacteria group bacterium]
MRAARQVNAMKAVFEVRRLQELAAEKAAAKAAEALRSAQAGCDERSRQLRSDQEDWARTVTDASLGLPVAALWARQVAQSEAAVKSAEAEVDAAERHNRTRSDEWSAALARSETASELAQAVFRSAKRAREEAALNELTDRASRSGAAR